MAGERALSLAAPAEAADFYRLAVRREPTPTRRWGWGRALYQQGHLAEARTALEAALHEFEVYQDRPAAARACITLADALLRAGRFEEVLHWAERGLGYLDGAADPETQALAFHVIGAARLHAGHPPEEVERYHTDAARLAEAHHLPAIAARSRFGLGNVAAQRGDLVGALQAFCEAIKLAQAAGDHFHEILGHNNVAYHALLLGDLITAHEQIEIGLALAEARALYIVRQWLYSTRGQIALAEKRWDEAKDWFRRGLAEAERHANPEMTASYHANLERVGQGRTGPE